MDRYSCDLGIATDGDADRLGVIDDQGQFVHPNKLLVLLYYYHNMTLKEIAGALNISQPSVSRRMSHAKKQLRSLLKEEVL